MSTLYTDNIRANNASQITVPSGQKIVGTDAGSIVAPGSVIQRTINKGIASGHESTSSSSLAASSFLTGSITSKANNSLFCIVAWHGMMHTQAGTIGLVNCQRTVGGVNTKIQTGGSYDGSSYVDLSIGDSSYNNQYFPLSFHYSDLPSASAGTSITYSMLFAREGGSNLFYFVHTQGPYYFEITEIAQ